MGISSKLYNRTNRSEMLLLRPSAGAARGLVRPCLRSSSWLGGGAPARRQIDVLAGGRAFSGSAR